MNPATILSGHPAATSAAAEPVSPVAVLVVDDNASKRRALRAVLTPLGFLIVEADSGLAALRCIIAQDFAVVLLDVRMPIMGGFETAALIRLRRQSEVTPIIFVTAHGADEIVADRYKEGAVDFMFAPVQPDELRAKVTFFVAMFVKAQELAAQARQVQASADQLRLLTEAAPIGIFQTDADNNYVYTNPQWSQITGVSAEDAAGQAWHIIIGPEQHAALMVELDGAVQPAEFNHRFDVGRPDSATRVVVINSRPIPDNAGAISGWVGTLSDVTVQARAEALMSEAQGVLKELNVELAVTARRDPLTGLGNRLALQEDLELLEARAARYGHRYCLALLDIDHFKRYNDAYGHQAGDVCLQAVAAELRLQARAGDGLYRYGGEEFLCVLPEQNLAAGTIAIQRMRGAVQKLAIPHNGNSFGVVTISGGLATLDPGGGTLAKDVLKEADDALYRAKQLGRNRVEQVASTAPEPTAGSHPDDEAC
jgi:diguanylate cyclase (GGDEF)-like protein/PAS domain S-box-containing protein